MNIVLHASPQVKESRYLYWAFRGGDDGLCVAVAVGFDALSAIGVGLGWVGGIQGRRRRRPQSGWRTDWMIE